MERLRGELMADLLFRTPQLSCETALAYAAQTAAGLSALHRAGIVHCDIKPDNLFLTVKHGVPHALTPSGVAMRVKILDFGLAEVAGRSVESETHAVHGTAQFMAPEQVLGDPVDARTDVYSLGVDVPNADRPAAVRPQTQRDLAPPSARFTHSTAFLAVR